MNYKKVLKKLKPFLTHENKYVFGICLTYKNSHGFVILKNHPASYILSVLSDLNIVIKYKGKKYTIDKVIENNYLLDILDNAEQPDNILQVYLKPKPFVR